MNGKYVFIDRDGVINKDPGGWTEYSYVTRREDFYFLPRVLEALKVLNDDGFRVVIISNQQGVGKGYFTENDLKEVTDGMVDEIKEAAVLSRPDPKWGQRPVAFVVIKNENVTSGQLQDNVAARMPKILTPDIIIADEIPLTGSGKYDRRALAKKFSEIFGNR